MWVILFLLVLGLIIYQSTGMDYFVEPFIHAIAHEWKSQELVQEKSRLAFVKEYIQVTLRSQSWSLRFVVRALCLLFLFSVRLMFWKSFAELDASRAVRFIQSWRDSRWPGCALLVQLFENLIALSMFAECHDG